MLTTAQISAIIMLLQAFGVGTSTINTVYNELLPTQAQSASIPQVGAVSTTTASFAAPVVDEPQPLSCSVTLGLTQQAGRAPFLQASWEFTEDATGTFSGPYVLSYEAPAAAFVGGIKPSIYPLQSHSYNQGAVGFYSPQGTGSVTLTVTEDGYQPVSCSANV